MGDNKALIALGSLLVGIMALIWTIWRDTKKRPKVVVTRDKTPASDAELVADDGAQFSISSQTGIAHVPGNYVGTIIIVRHLNTRRELTRFALRSGLNEINF